ncbi:hypothetical protein [Desulfobacterium sp. N47]|uniref:hypothetical protein n=1 Tax=Desulfobacterium sp. N47 TaxID=3115210 RepID=UPI003CAE8936
MFQIRWFSNLKTFALLSVVFMLVFSGCAALSQNENSATASASVQKDIGDMPSYYDFGDVLVPKELKVKIEKSFIYKTSGLPAGVLALSGRVELSSLCTFFDNNMAKDNWKLVSLFKSPHTLMLFQKQNRWCVINIVDGMIFTDVEIWVAPSIAENSSGLIK